MSNKNNYNNSGNAWNTNLRDVNSCFKKVNRVCYTSNVVAK